MRILKVKPTSAMAIYAHPDDADVAAGGMMAQWASEGCAVHLVVICDGAKGSHVPQVDARSLREVRHEELQLASDLLGAATVECLDHVDGDVTNDEELRATLVGLIRKYRPEVVVGPDPTATFFGGVYVNHRDHRETGWALLDAVAPAAGGWIPVAPGSDAFDPSYPVPVALDESGIAAILNAFAAAAQRTLDAGGSVIEIHGAHGYLIHQFLSPLINHRTDRWGGSFENRTRLAIEVVRRVRSVWPERLPLFVRISATDYVAGGWDLEQSVELARVLREEGVDLIDASSGGAVPLAPGTIPLGPLYQTPFAERIRREAGIATGAVGLITEPADAEAIVAEGRADLVLLARELLRDPYWPHYAARALGAQTDWPEQYGRAAGERATMRVPART